MSDQGHGATSRGPLDRFDGDVYIDAMVRASELSRVNISAVRFAPGSRTAWHSHAVNQTLIVTDGMGLHQRRGGQVEQIRTGDVVVSGPGVWHWHGAAADRFMTHLSITESAGTKGPDVEWGEHVQDK